MSDEFYWIAVAAVTVMSTARLTRLVVVDKFPPMVWLRAKYADLTDRHNATVGYGLLLFCVFCASFWIALAVIGWGLWADVYGSGSQTPQDADRFLIWWLVNGAFGGSYLAAIVTTRDGDDDR